jgi:hypothetical protein
MTILLPALATALAVFCVWLVVRVVNRRERWAMMIAALGIWNVVCLGAMRFYQPTIGRAVLAVYTSHFGDIEESFGTFFRINECIAVPVVTAMATAVTLWFLESLTRSRTTWRRRGVREGVREGPPMILRIATYCSD